MEEENQVFGHGAEDTNKLNSEEKFSIYHEDKEDAEKNIQASAKDLEDFFDSVIKDEPDPTEEEVNEGIRKILERAYPEEKTNKSKKVALRVLFIAALLSVLSFSCLFVVGNSHDISIENGFVTFAKDTVKVVFFDEDEEKRIDVKTLLEDLVAHGYNDIMFPQEFVTKSDEYKASLPEYKDIDGFKKIVSFDVYNDTSIFSFDLIEIDDDVDIDASFPDLDNAKTVVVDDVYVYLFEYASEITDIRFISNGIEYKIESEYSLNEMINIAKTLAKMER